MNTFLTKNYTFESEKVKGDGVKFALLADLHGFVFGEGNRILVDAIGREKPDAVLIAGDMLIKMEEDSGVRAGKFLAELSGKYPVYYGLGNHECKMCCTEFLEDDYRAYEQSLTEAGVIFLHNEHRKVNFHSTDFMIHGLELPMEYYHKPNPPKLSPETVEKLIGVPGKDCFNILIAHNPRYGSTYFSWGADLTVSGHYHGGIVRFTEHVGLCSPQYLLFPPYCCGDFHKSGSHMVVSAGLGEHTIPLRIHNPRELILINIKPLQKQ